MTGCLPDHWSAFLLIYIPLLQTGNQFKLRKNISKKVNWCNGNASKWDGGHIQAWLYIRRLWSSLIDLASMSEDQMGRLNTPLNFMNGCLSDRWLAFYWFIFHVRHPSLHLLIQQGEENQQRDQLMGWRQLPLIEVCASLSMSCNCHSTVR